MHATPELLTTSQVAALLGVEPWRIRRLYEEGLLSEPQRLGGRRLVSSRDLPAVIDSLRQKGWLSSVTSANDPEARRTAG